MINWPQAAILLKNKLSSGSPFLTFLKVSYTGLSDICLVENNENITWNGIIWTRFPIKIGTDNIDRASDPKLTASISNCGGLIEAELQKYNGLAGADVSIYIQHADLLDSATPLNQYDYTIGTTQYNEQWVTFNLEASPYLKNRFPEHTYTAHYCPFKFKSIRCGYNGNAKACNNTADTCLILERFGGEEGMNTYG